MFILQCWNLSKAIYSKSSALVYRWSYRNWNSKFQKQTNLFPADKRYLKNNPVVKSLKESMTKAANVRKVG